MEVSATEEIYSVLTRIGYNLNDYGNSWRTMPLYRASGNNMSISIKKSTGEWFDYSAKIGGSLPYLVKLTLNVSMEEARRMFNSTAILTMPIEEVEQAKIFDKELLLKLNKDYSYWINRGISKETLQIFEGGIAGKVGKMANRYVFPIFDLRDNLVGFSGRYLTKTFDKIPKWKILGDKMNWIYPYKYNNHFIKEKEEVILVESIGDMLSLWESGIKNVLVVFGVEVSSDIINFLIRLNLKKVIIAFNNDEDNGFVGNDSAEKARNQLCSFFDLNQIEIRLPCKNDFNVMTVQEIQEWYKQNPPCSNEIVINMKDNHPYDIYVGRNKERFHFGNPFGFKVGGLESVSVLDRTEAVENYEAWLRGDPKWMNVESERREWILKNLETLRNKRLACWCFPLLCHANVLIRLLKEKNV